MCLWGPIARKTFFAVMLHGLLYCAAATAAELGIYKHVDEKGKVVYSQVPPASGAGVKKLKTQPAYVGQGGLGPPVSPYEDSRSYNRDYGQDQYHSVLQRRQQQMQDEKNKRLAELEAECNRNRGTDCSNPEVLRYIESTKIPGQSRRYR